MKLCRQKAVSTSRFLVGLLFSLLTMDLHADVTILIHGLNGDGANWRHQGIVQQLTRTGRIDAGHLSARGPIMFIPPDVHPSHSLFTVDLPSHARINEQAEILIQMIQALGPFYSQQPLTLVGHSAGGLVARRILLNYPALNITRLITIATPHMGSSMATMGSAVKSSPFGLMANMVGMDPLPGNVRLLRDLHPPRENNFLGWLNSRYHPHASYASVVRKGGDSTVSAFSQNMNNIPALRRRSLIIYSPGGHALQPIDGDILASLLSPTL